MFARSPRRATAIFSLFFLIAGAIAIYWYFAAGAPKTLHLAAREAERDKGPLPGHLLLRELARQAVLIAGRDQLGLSTRDMTLREDVPPNVEGKAISLDVLTNARPGRNLRVRVFPYGAPEAELAPLFDGKLDQQPLPDKVTNYVYYVEELEALSRNELVEVLRMQGFQGDSLAWKSDVSISEQVERWLLEMNFFSQFAALRALHAQERSGGQSPSTLGAIVRAYANLALLTSFHWNASSQVFAARSLLYAQRLIVLDERSGWAMRHRAYALALFGLHAAALEDLAAAGNATSAKDPGRANGTCAWEPLIDAYCRYDRKVLEQPFDGELRELVAVINFLIVENSQSESLTLSVGARSAEVVPECYMINAGMGRFKGVSNRHQTTVAGPAVLQESLNRRLKAMPELPDEVAAQLVEQPAGEARDPAFPDPRARIAIERALLESGAQAADKAEPSWQVLGRLLEDLTFVHAYNRLEFFRYGLSVPIDSFRDAHHAALELVGDYPYKAAIEQMVLDKRLDDERIRQLCATMPLVDVGIFLYPFAGRVWYQPYPNDEKFGIHLWNLLTSHAEDTAPKLERIIALSGGEQLPEVMRLRQVSPHSPHGVALTLSKGFKVKPDQMRTWEKDFAGNPTVLRALANRYLEMKSFEDAERCARQYLKETPEQSAYDLLANIYKSQNKVDRWKEVLEESLKSEDFSLSHARTRVKLAEFHMERGEFDQALPYARAAADTGAAWAMMCAAECYEGLKKWDEAEQMMQATAQRYDSEAFVWYYWCRRTGHGNVMAAQAFALEEVARLTGGARPGNLIVLGHLYLLMGDPERSLEEFGAGIVKGHPYCLLHAAILAQQRGDITARDAALVDAVERGPTYLVSNIEPATDMIAVANWLLGAVRQPAGQDPPIDKLTKTIEPFPPSSAAAAGYFVGRYFQLVGNDKLARTFYQRSLDSRDYSHACYALSGLYLREMNEAAK